MKINRLNFLDDLVLKEQVSKFYIRIMNTYSSTLLSEDSAQKIDKGNLIVIKDIPSYLLTQAPLLNKVKSASMYHGFLINLGKYENIEAYLISKFSSKRRSNHRTFRKRLELCFNVRYQMYYGWMEKREYDYLFNHLRQMIQKRFTIKQMKHSGWGKMDSYQKLIYQRILEKRASIFAIYHDSTPISISINLIEGDVYAGFIMAFDVDFSKFYPGLTNILKQLEWCFENNFQVFDMMKGDVDYKKVFADEIYIYQSQIIISSQSILSKIIANVITYKTEFYYKLLHLLKKWNLHLVYRSFKASVYGLLHKKAVANVQSEYDIQTVSRMNVDLEWTKIGLENTVYENLRRPIYNYLYSNFESVNDIEVFRKSDGTSYLVKGKKSSVLIRNR